MSEKTVLQSSIAGSWYPADSEALKKRIGELLDAVDVSPVPSKSPEDHPPKNAAHHAFLVPHAAYAYSGRTAAFVYHAMKRLRFRRVILLAPSHRVWLENRAVIPDADAVATPLGNLPLDKHAGELLACPLIHTDNHTHELEHSTQIQYPFLRAVLPENASVLPVIIGNLDEPSAEEIARFLRPLLTNETALLISSDFTHYGTDFSYRPCPVSEARDTIRALDFEAFELIRANDPAALCAFIEKTGATICGSNPIRVALHAMTGRVSACEMLHYETSADGDGDFSRFVCYMAIGFRFLPQKMDSAFPAGETPFSISDDDKRRLLSLASESILYTLKHRKLPPRGFMPELTSESIRRIAGVFVTLKDKFSGALRGCIGEIAGTRPVRDAVVIRACDAAFGDPRFRPIESDEWPTLQLEISVLTPLRRILSTSEITIGKHGILLSKHGRSAVFLPQVASEQGWDLDETLSHLAMKAGLPPDGWREGAVFEIFEAVVFSDEGHPVA